MSLYLFRHAMTRSPGIRANSRRFTTGHTTSECKSAGDETRSPVYELRTYNLHPHKMREYLNLTAKEFHLRTAHSKLVGFWTSEIGGLNQVVHIWEYGSLTERSSVRARLAADPEWVGRYLSQILPMLQCQENTLMTLFPGTQLTLPSSKGVYELQTLKMQGRPSSWTNIFLQWVQQCEEARSDAGTMKVGVWGSVLGHTPTTVVLWHHTDPDGCVALADAVSSVPESGTLTTLVTDFHKKLLLPHDVSPLQ